MTRPHGLRMLRRRLAVCSVVGALLGVWVSGASASALHVIPFPGTPDAAPSTQVIFSSLSPSDLRQVIVIGARSGDHAGRLVALPDGAGTAFIARAAFLPGERVWVRAVLASPAAGTASGDAGSTQLSFSFGVGRMVRAGAAGHGATEGPRGGATGRPGQGVSGRPRQEGPGRAAASAAVDTQSFHSAPQLRPVALSVTSDPDTSSGDIFITPYNTPQVGPMILDGHGGLVWFRPVSPGEALNLQVQHYRGQPVLTWWQGPLSFTHGTIYGLGEDVIANSAYQTLAVLHGANGYTPDLHEFQITPQGTALLDEYVPVHENLTRLGGPSDGTVLDCVIQELDIRTGQVLWEWHSLGHVPLRRSYWQAPTNSNVWWDYFHMNSIEQLPDGNLLISSRNTWAIYEISRQTGRVIWTLGGKHSSFSIGPGANFEWQHDARMHPGQILSLFDDASSPQEERQASAKFLQLDTRTMTAQLVKRYPHSPPLLAGLAGNAQLLPNNDVFVGWGGAPDFSEFAPGGRQIFNGTFPGNVGTYRAFRFRWTGRPLTRPSVAVSGGHGGALTVYASWNGATEVARWRVLGGSRPGALHRLGLGSVRSGFETALSVPAPPSYVAVQAVDAGGRVLGTSRSVAR